MQAETNMEIHKIAVIVGVDLIGDALVKLPFARALRAAWPQAKIHWLTSKGKSAYGGPLRAETRGLIDEVIEQPAWLPHTGNRTADTAAAPHYDLIIDTRGRWKEALLARKLPHKLFITPAWRFLFSDRKPGLIAPLLQPKKPHLVDRLLQLVALASGREPKPEGKLQLDQALVQKARALLPHGRTYVGFAPGAGNRLKVWPREKFIAAAQAQTAQPSGARQRVPVFVLGPDEIDWRAPIAEAVPQALFPLQDRAHWENEKISLGETLALGATLTCCAANDSGTSHMLAAAGCPLVSLFGPTDPAKLAPRAPRGRILRAQNFGMRADMDAIPVEAVTGALDDLLKEII
ncbi:MAG: lipopolysaccharide heptosyltransferase family protein [Alphaproteobacteria bacterium]|nr:lipopolysaccharide heptosyltransferase family protein [Alphaproteobacteria bacterium]